MSKESIEVIKALQEENAELIDKAITQTNVIEAFKEERKELVEALKENLINYEMAIRGETRLDAERTVNYYFAEFKD